MDTLSADDSAAAEEINAAIERAVGYVEAGADVIFQETMNTLDDYRRFKPV
ncbi:2-methylisocitrate lyase-like PEP mutase family enzyme [Paraburkholderia sp. JPY419]